MDSFSDQQSNSKAFSSHSPMPSSANAQLRKIKKPLIEKRRRERINECLVQLKALVLEAMNKDGSQYNKMEKADILEMTVAHLKSICGPSSTRHRSADSTVDTASMNAASVPSAPAAAQRYVSGYTECAIEVANYLSTSTSDPVTSSVAHPAAGDVVRRGLLEHLDTCLHRQSGRFTLACSANSQTTSPPSSSPNEERVGTDRTRSPRHVLDNFARSSVTSFSATGQWRSCDDGVQQPQQENHSSSEDEHSRNSTVDRLAFNANNYAAIVAATSLMSRSRCDSGVYSGASSPTGDSENTLGADDLPLSSSSWSANRNWLAMSSSPGRLVTSPPTASTTSASVSSRVEIAHRRYSPATDLVKEQDSCHQQQLQVLNLTVRAADADVWRPW